MKEYDNLGDIPINELAHYGVKGMKWGVRRDSPGARLRREAKEDLSREKNAKPGTVRSTKKEISNKRAERPDYDKTYRSVKKNQERIETGAAFAKFAAKIYATNLLLSALVGPANSSPSAKRRSSQGQSYASSKPPMMNARLQRDGVYKVRSFR